MPAFHDQTEQNPGTREASTPSSSLRTFSAGSLAREILQNGWSAEAWPRPAQLRAVLVFAVVSIFSWLGIILSRQSDGVATIWFSNGILFGLLITQPPRRWLAYFLLGLGGDTLADVIFGDPFALAIGVSVANSIEVILSAVLLTLLFGAPLHLARRKPLVGFLLVSVVGATALTGLLGAAWTMHFARADSLWEMWRTWYLGDMLGMAILPPLIVILQRPNFFGILHPRRAPRTLLVLSIPVLTTALIFLDSRDPLLFFLFPALLLVAFRLGYPGTVLNLVLLTLLVIGLTIRGRGPLMLIPGEHMLLHRIVIAQIFLAVAIFTMFPIAALIEEQDALKLSLAASERSYRELAHRDELTGLLNRRGFNLQLEQTWQRALDRRETVALLLLDADLFKQYNDVHGHLEGDECLRAIAGAITTAVDAGNGIAARFGGEEFAVILPAASRKQALALAETIRQAAVGCRLANPSAPNGVQTVSVGVASLIPLPTQQPADLINRADAALYTAKMQGRNQVAHA